MSDDVSPQLKALLAERRRAEEDRLIREHIDVVRQRKEADRIQRTMDKIDAAKSRLDAGHDDPRKFLPSSLLKIGYCVLATSDVPNAEIKAMDFVSRSLANWDTQHDIG